MREKIYKKLTLGCMNYKNRHFHIMVINFYNLYKRDICNKTQ